MQLVVPSAVNAAVRMDITICTTVFHVSFFIVLPFLFSFFHYYIFSFSHLSPLTFSPLTSPPFPLPIGRAGVGLLSVIRTCGVRSAGAATTLRWAAAGLLLTRQLAVQLRAQLGALLHG